MDPFSGHRRVIHLLAPAEFGGLETVVAQLAGGQVERGHSVLVAALLGTGPSSSPFIETLRRQGVESCAIRTQPRGYLAERSSVRKLLREWRPEVLHTQGYRPDVVDAPVARRESIASVSTVHGFTGGGRKNQLYEWIQKRSFRSFQAVVAVSRPIAEQLVATGTPPSRVHVIPNRWIPPKPFLERNEARGRLGLEGRAQIIGWVGRLSSEKAPDLMLTAPPRLGDPRAILVMVGDGPMRGELERFSSELGLEGQVRWLGAVEHAFKFMTALDVLALSSRTEGSPMVLLEAMAAGTPIVGTRVGGVPGLVSVEEATLVAGGDAQELAAAVAAVLADPDGAQERAIRAKRRLASEGSLSTWVQEYDKVYRSAVL